MANKEVLLCAGAIASPILQRSGSAIRTLAPVDSAGPRLPGVVENLQDHLEMYLVRVQRAGIAVWRWHNGESAENRRGMAVRRHRDRSAITSLKRADLAAAAAKYSPAQYHFCRWRLTNGSKIKSMVSVPRWLDAFASRGHVRLNRTRMPIRQSCSTICRATRLAGIPRRHPATREIMNQPALDKYRGREISPKT